MKAAADPISPSQVRSRAEVLNRLDWLAAGHGLLPLLLLYVIAYGAGGVSTQRDSRC